MSFDLESLKDKLPGEMLEKLRAHVDDLASRAETAEEKARKAAKESIDGRKSLKAERDRAFEKLGIANADELDTLPEARGQGEAAKQLDAQIKRAVRERDDAIRARDELMATVKGMKRETALASAIEGHKFRNPADVRVLLQHRVVEEGDDLLFKTDEGKLVPLKDGAAWFAKTRPDYVEASGGSGSGSGFKGSSSGVTTGKTVTRAQLEAMPHEQRGQVLSTARLIDA